MFLATLQQIAEAPKAKARRRINRTQTTKARIERERKAPKLHTPKQSNAKRQVESLAKWRRIFLGNEVTAEQAADAAQCKLAGAYSAIKRLRDEKKIIVVRSIPRTGITGRSTLVWTWNTKAEEAEEQ